MQWLDENQEITPGLLTHVDRCLHCGACEAMCPSLVPFGALMDSARARLTGQRKQRLIERVFSRISTLLLTSPPALRLASPLLDVYRRLGLPVLLGKLPGPAGRINRLLTHTRNYRGQQKPAPATERRGEAHNLVHIFPGCTGQALDSQTLLDSQKLLHALGFNAISSRDTACCGALHQHSGQTDTASSMAGQNRAALNDDAPIISIASGCAAHLKNYDAFDAKDSSTSFSSRVSEIMAFLARQNPADLHFTPCETPVGVYIPCTQRNALQQSQAVFDVLSWIPQLELRHVNPQGGCCGAAGSYMLKQPEISDALGDAVVERVIDCGVRTLVTTNIGCSIQLQARLRTRGVAVEVIHPVTLLWRQLND
ncbi:Glycolate dehydrogenase, iron-sulfur subunit GlcF [hydrothermal vent metagenome]|uniref:Glycolate dehydrogenase, iron-sulfur subunit GlcF n=1 Tax=hydrothermal vent metagenome TaxID=652676 RepID=A0A3B0YCQ1_9ZZZZ